MTCDGAIGLQPIPISLVLTWGSAAAARPRLRWLWPLANRELVQVSRTEQQVDPVGSSDGTPRRDNSVLHSSADRPMNADFMAIGETIFEELP